VLADRTNGISAGNPLGFPFHKGSYLGVAAKEEEADVVGEFEYNAILQGSANFPVVTLPILEAESFWQGCLSIEIAHQCVYGFIGFLLAVRPKFRINMDIYPDCLSFWITDVGTTDSSNLLFLSCRKMNIARPTIPALKKMRLFVIT
jgi:hypothetical protein